ncbi:M3 family metallopeptidase [Hyphomicrobium facile]|uniref:Peptidyl-dipeptidase Dcp n=1 Tax=Hyphomicrobium facile TaxID=51670 RepID=A0A1I7NSJ6_9HYPH|nr:M3 family metallopeptidase [Hyphomicrobium facile]SFV37649.1 peptidyl-dipeptidase Dcp [Hyphomicrobium facile]
MIAKRKAAPKPRSKPSINPLMAKWNGPFAMPPFAKIEARHFKPALDAAFREHKAEIEKIAKNPAKPTFANTIVAFEKSGWQLSRVASVFWNLEGSDSTPEFQEIAREMAPRFAAHETQILLDKRLFKRIDDLNERRNALKLSEEDLRVLERHHLEFVRAGARLSAADKSRVKEINARLATLVTQFMQNVLKDEQSWRLVLDGENDLAGLPDTLKESAERAAADAGFPGKAMITLARSSVEGFLTYSSRRDLREQAFNAWTRRGAHAGETDNRQIVAEAVALRGEYARLMGFASFAEFSLQDTMAKTPGRVDELLRAVWEKAVVRAGEERDALTAEAVSSGDNSEIMPWDWRYYSERVRKAKYDFDESKLQPYLELDQMIRAAFDTASRLFGLKFQERKDLPRYHPEVRVWEVLDKKGAHVGIFMGDYFARPTKRSGAWMSAFRAQHKLGKGQSPIIVNVLNFAKGGEGEPALLSFDDARTLFHEFGHGLHGLLSNVTYPSISGTSVSRDFVELPSQLYEHWLSTAEVLEKHALHYKTGKPMPKVLRQRLAAARNFNQGFATVEYTSSALVDMALYSAETASIADVEGFERVALAQIDMPKEIVMRHRLPHFMHIMSGYAAGYYSYLWSEVMDADAFAAFEETGNVFHPGTAKKLHEFIYSAGNRRDPHAAYVAFRGRPPKIDGLLKKRGLAA